VAGAVRRHALPALHPSALRPSALHLPALRLPALHPWALRLLALHLRPRWNCAGPDSSSGPPRLGLGGL